MTDEVDLDELAEELSEFDKPEKSAGRSPREERIIAGFEDVQRFVEKHGRAPQHGEDRDIFERIYAVRLDRLRALEECRTLLEPLDHQGLLAGTGAAMEATEDDVDEEELLSELAEVDEATAGISRLRHVRSSSERRAADEVASRQPCRDFDRFNPLFELVQKELENGSRETRPFELKAEIEPGRFFIVGGQKAYVAGKGDAFTNAQGRQDARLRVIFDNGTESNMLMRSLQRALNDDEAGRRITEPTAGPLFSDHSVEGDEASGTIYVLRSKSSLPLVAEHRELVHKIGVTNLPVEKRIAGARLQPTFLMADVEVVATYELFNINRTRLENLIHRIFAPARLDIEVRDRFGNPVVPREWFLVPLFVIDEAVAKIRDGSIAEYIYDRDSASLQVRKAASQ
ncbi:MAG: GIY-YIG nuclease family protein [Pseudomonadota bacterium]|nr:GIY-YIG nuclease family protein [Pseudomonadota bacterium]